jgi:4-coumarate--CoA ligase
MELRRTDMYLGLTGLVHQPLYRGIELVVMPRFDLDIFCRTIQNHRITFVYIAPPVLVVLSRDPRVANYDLSSLRMVTSGAAPLTRELVDTVHKKLNIKVNQAYGLSETSPMTHTQVYPPLLLEDRMLKPPALGRMV